MKQQENDWLIETEQAEIDIEKQQKKQKVTRNDFQTVGKYDMPLIKRQRIDLDKIDLWGYNKAKHGDIENQNKTIHFFTHDWKFESVYEKPEIAMEKLDGYYALLTPDFSLYMSMPKAVQIYNTFKNRWCGAYWQQQGKLVIPTISWSSQESYDFCFDGIEKGSVIALATYYTESYEREFMAGYNKMLEVLQPSAIICYGEPFAEMRGNIKSISPYNKEAIIESIGFEEFAKRYIEGTLYPNK